MSEIFFLFTAAVNILAWYVLLTIPRDTIVTALNVGQGDAILIQTPQLQHILIDGGPDSSVLAGLGRHIPFYNQRIDLIVLTHPHADHLAGLIDVVQRMPVDRVMMTSALNDSALYRQFCALIEARHIPIVQAHVGQTIRFGVASEPELTILYPFGDFSESASSRTASQSYPQPTNLNNTSIVMMLDDKQDVLFMGDAEREVEQELLMAGLVFPSDVMKVGHHGSKTSSTEEFLRAVAPSIAIISVGAKNKFNHPSPEVVTRLAQMHIDVRRTDRSDAQYVLRYLAKRGP